MKSDSEGPMVALREALAKLHGGMITPEQPPKREPAANGRVEETGRTIRDMVRVLKLQLEAKLKRSIAIQEPITHWMVRWAAMMCSRYLVGKDGLTAYERRRGRKCILPVVLFGEKVWYKECLGGKGEER
mgnify:CR=1 FL=1